MIITTDTPSVTCHLAEPGGRDGCLSDHQAPGLRHPGRSHRQSVFQLLHADLILTLAVVSNLHKETKKTFSHVIEDLYRYVNPKNNRPSPMISKETYEAVMENAARLDSAIIFERDFHYNLSVVRVVVPHTIPV